MNNMPDKEVRAEMYRELHNPCTEIVTKNAQIFVVSKDFGLFNQNNDDCAYAIINWLKPGVYVEGTEFCNTYFTSEDGKYESVLELATAISENILASDIMNIHMKAIQSVSFKGGVNTYGLSMGEISKVNIFDKNRQKTFEICLHRLRTNVLNKLFLDISVMTRIIREVILYNKYSTDIKHLIPNMQNILKIPTPLSKSNYN